MVYLGSQAGRIRELVEKETGKSSLYKYITLGYLLTIVHYGWLWLYDKCYVSDMSIADTEMQVIKETS